jgi:hypothetical protein
LHSGDLHLGKPFGQFPEEVRARLITERGQIMARLAQAARAVGARHVLLAGDTFDAETPSPRLIRQFQTAIAASADLTFVVMPGNHDSLSAPDLWGRVAANAPPNLVLALTPGPVLLAPDVALLPAPVTARRPGTDLTTALDMPTPPGVRRIGLAHGPVTSFDGEVASAPATIAPDRAARSGLDYLALGDWHGQMAVGPVTWYAGTPEPDSFRHGQPGRALAVTLVGAGAVAQVMPVLTGALTWIAPTLTLAPGGATPALLQTILPPASLRDAHLIDLHLTGRAGLFERAELMQAIAHCRPDFQWLSVRDAVDLALAPDDLGQIDDAGALRLAADRLAAEAIDETRPTDERHRAARALSTLYALAVGT